MVLTSRPIPKKIPHPPQCYEKPQNQVLANVAGEKMVGLIQQIGMLSDFAADIFSGLFRDASATFERVRAVSQRVQQLEAFVPTVNQTFESLPPSTFYNDYVPPKPFKREDRPQDNQLQPANLPNSLKILREAAEPPPNFSLLDKFSPVPDKPCKALYSDPGFFFDMWLKEELARQQKLEEENAARKEKRRKKKKEKQQQMKTVELVKMKTYSALGKEFEEKKPEAPTQPQKPALEPMAEEPAEEEEEAHATQLSAVTASRPAPPPPQSAGIAPPPPFGQPPAPPMAAAPMAPPMGAPMATPMAPPSMAPPMVPRPSPPLAPPAPPEMAPPMGIAPPAPPMAPAATPMAPAPPMAPAFSAPPLTAPPLDSGAPSAPPLPAVSSDRGDLLSQIRSGTTLRKVERTEEAPAAAGGRTGLLADIRNRNVQLRSVKREELEKPKAPPVGTSAMQASIMDILARRAAIQGDSDSDDDWE